jgi:hypothetical protein
MLCLLPVTAAMADDVAPPTTDVFSYSYLEVNRLSEHSDFFNDRSAGDGLKFSYDTADSVYLFGQWNRLDFDQLGGSHDVYGIGVGAHQAYNSTVSFYTDLSLLRDKLGSSVKSTLAGDTNNYWRFTYGFRGQLNSYLELDGGIFTERNTNFGERPFGERLGFGVNLQLVSIMLSGERTADGNRTELSIMWNFK